MDSKLLIPKDKTLKKWQDKYSWLKIVNVNDKKKMICTVCTSQEEKLKLMPRANLTFVNGSTNFKLSTLADHVNADSHKQALREKKYAEAVAAGTSLAPVKITQEVPSYSAIGVGLKRMGEKEKDAIIKLNDIAHYVAVKGRAFTHFQDLIELEKLHGVKFQSGSYENETGCKDFIKNIADYFFKKDLYDKLLRVNFIAILCDGTTDTSIIEQEVIYIFFVDPDTMESTLTFFECLGLESSQDANGMLEAIKAAFEKYNLSTLLNKMIFLSSDGASVNSGKKSGLVSLFKAEHEWVTFIWCFSHRLELALKDALKEYTAPVDESLMHLFYLYKNSSKKNRELKNLYQLMKDQFEMYGDGIRPVKSTGTRWIDHRVRAMQRFVDKFGLYCQHLQHAIPETKSSKDRAKLQGKFDKLVDAKVLLRSSFFVDVLSAAKQFSLATQKDGTNIISIVDNVESTKRSYEKLLRKFETDGNKIFSLPTLKSVVTEIESNEDGEPEYQGQKVKYYTREKLFLKNNAAQMVQQILSCYDERYSNLYVERNNDDLISDGDNVLFDICRILNSKVWPSLEQPDSDDEQVLSHQLTAVTKIYQKYKLMDVFTSTTLNSLIIGYIDVVRYAYRYFNIDSTDPMKLWSKLCMLGKDKESWKDIIFLIELCLCTPFSNATLERFFIHLKVVKTELRSKLSSESLNSIMRIRMKGVSLADFNEKYAALCTEFWYNSKSRRLNQRKRKTYSERVTTKKRRPIFNIDESESSSSDSSAEDI